MKKWLLQKLQYPLSMVQLKGKYKIEVDFFNDGSLTLAGPAAVMAEIYTYYSSGKQERKIITIYLDRNKERNIGIGEFSFQ